MRRSAFFNKILIFIYLSAITWVIGAEVKTKTDEPVIIPDSQLYSQWDAHEDVFESEKNGAEEQQQIQRLRLTITSIILVVCLLLLSVLYFLYLNSQKKNREMFKRIKEQDAEQARNEALLQQYGMTIHQDASSTDKETRSADKNGISTDKDTMSDTGNRTPDKNRQGEAGPNEFVDNSRQYTLFIRLRDYLVTNRKFADPELNADIIAAELYTNRTYLSEAVRAFSGRKMQDYIHSLRLEDAKNLLETTNDTIDEIASKCGYPSVRTFYRLFHSKYNISPAAYRNIAKE